MPKVDEIMERLDNEGYRLTGPRRIVVGQIVRHHTPFTSAELLETVRHNSPAIGRATVFRTLDLLCRIGLVQRIHEDAHGGRCHAYIACDERHHHHLICNSCGTVRDFNEDEALDALVREVEKRTAFQIEGHRLELVGLCPSCQSKNSITSS